MKAKEIREMNEEEIKSYLHELREELLSLRFQQSLGNLRNPARFKQVRREIARVLTILREKGVKT